MPGGEARPTRASRRRVPRKAGPDWPVRFGGAPQGGARRGRVGLRVGVAALGCGSRTRGDSTGKLLLPLQATEQDCAGSGRWARKLDASAAASGHVGLQEPSACGDGSMGSSRLGHRRASSAQPHGPFTAAPAPPCRSCFIDEHVTRVAWLNRSNILYAGNDRWTSDPRVRLLVNTPEEFSILITQVGLGDEGLYTCSFQTRHQPYTTQVYLIVHVPARIVNISSPVTVNEGGNVNLLCLAVGRPEPTVTWRQLRDGFTSEGEILEISDIQRGQAGEYECVTHNGVNSAPDSRRVLVTVNCEPPSALEVTGVRHQNAGVLRVGLGRLGAVGSLTRVASRLSGGASEGLKVQTERTRSMLLFANVSARHYGNYTCRAANRLGASSASMRLLRPGSLENSAPRPPGPLTLLSALGWLWWRV
ncbi:PREDICTED: igLON family member 5 [Condylura cristata]|uniref:igLON family member 5 n=1 Tax=Condylura cristata TaxID=143302 RepID=UPI000643CFFB|nr:PREDICTED: igLON family member 5 [Condylura cristata]